MTQDYSHLSSLLRRLQDKWWKEMLAKQYREAAFTSNDLETAARGIANITHKLYEGTLDHADTSPPSKPDKSPSLPPASER